MLISSILFRAFLLFPVFTIGVSKLLYQHLFLDLNTESITEGPNCPMTCGRWDAI